jgi:hypothetical protein
LMSLRSDVSIFSVASGSVFSIAHFSNQFFYVDPPGVSRRTVSSGCNIDNKFIREIELYLN